MVPGEFPRQYCSFEGWRQSALTGGNGPTLHLDPTRPCLRAYYVVEDRLHLGVHPSDGHSLWRERSARL